MSATAADGSLSREPLEDLMLAMDVVDTLRHAEGLVSRELNAEARRQALIERLRNIYDAQGIAVTDAVLAEGVLALDEERFAYAAPEKSLAVRLARLYVSRDVWGKPVLLFCSIVSMLALAYYFVWLKPMALEREDLPRKLEETFARVVSVSKVDLAVSEAQSLLTSARTALEAQDYEQANALYAKLRSLRRVLEQDYQVRIVVDPSENSGIWRVPEVNSKARNYYLIVEATTKAGDRVTVKVRNEEDGKEYSVKRWGVRVNEETFEAVAADKQDDGIIQGNVVGRKEPGLLQPTFAIPVVGGTITEW